MVTQPFDDSFFAQLRAFLALPTEKLTELARDKIEEPTRMYLIRAGEAEHSRLDVERLEHLLKNSGTPPVAFTGNLIAEQSGPWDRGKQITRWIDLKLYRTETGKHVSHITFNSTREGESERQKVFYGDLPTCVKALQDWKPSEQLPGVGFPNPENKQFKSRQERLMASMDALYADRLSRLLDVLPADQIATRLE